MANTRRQRVVQLLAEDVQLQALMSLTPADIGQLVTLGDIYLQDGVHPTSDHSMPSRVISTDENGAPDYGSLVIRLAVGSASKTILSPSIWSTRHDYLCKCLYAVIEQHPSLIGSKAAPRRSEAESDEAVSRQPRRKVPVRVAPTPSVPAVPVPPEPMPSVVPVAPAPSVAPRSHLDLAGFARGFDSKPPKHNEVEFARTEYRNLAISNNAPCDILDERDTAVVPADSTAADEGPKRVPKELAGLVGFFNKRGNH